MDWLNKVRVDLQNVNNQIQNLESEAGRVGQNLCAAKGIRAYLEAAIKQATESESDAKAET